MDEFFAGLVAAGQELTGLRARIAAVTSADVRRALARARPEAADLMALLSPAAEDFLEDMALRAEELTLRNFGCTVLLYAPLYLSDACENECRYCGFRASRGQARRKLSLAEIEESADVLARQGIREVLVLTGEAPGATPWPYLEEAFSLLRQRFASVGIEIFPLDDAGYQRAACAGADSLTLYQETYDRAVYAELHPRGPKRDFDFRLDAPMRGARAGFRAVTVGALLGLAEPRSDALLCALHARSLQLAHPSIEVGIAAPRLTAAGGGFAAVHPVPTRLFVQILLAYRLFLPRASLTVSTREPPALRDSLLGLGVTRMSAGSQTEVGGYLRGAASAPQFAVHDARSVSEVVAAIRARRMQPEFKNWERPK